jgi:hypothetical protein
MVVYYENSMQVQDGLIVRPNYIQQQWVDDLIIPLDQLQVCSHHLRIDTKHHITQSKDLPVVPSPGDRVKGRDCLQMSQILHG